MINISSASFFLFNIDFVGFAIYDGHDLVIRLHRSIRHVPDLGINKYKVLVSNSISSKVPSTPSLATCSIIVRLF